jgi:signal transduction histidine kinase
VVAHELRAPLGAILGWVHLLAQRGSEEEFRKGLEVIEQSAEVQGKLIQDLLVMSRMASNRMSFDLAQVDLREVIDAAVDAVRPAADAKRMRLRKVIDSSAGPVRGDATRLLQVLSNLLTNALKFTPQGGWIEVSLQRTGGWAQVEVADSGSGIAPEFLPHVFDRFRQDPATAQQHGGLGLGLAIARHLVELHGGEIEARSGGEGRGATFTVRLPLADPAGAKP